VAIVTASNHFVRAYRLPIRPISTTAGVAYASFALSESRGLIVEDGGTPLYYVDVDFLWHAINLNAAEIGLGAASALPLNAYLLRAFLNKKDPLHQRLLEEFKKIDKDVEVAVVQVERRHLHTHDNEPERRNSVVAVRGPGGQIAGWYFGRVDIVEPLMSQTTLPKFRCKSCGKDHDDPDGNVCDETGGPIY
jgi:hypothetical protein